MNPFFYAVFLFAVDPSITKEILTYSEAHLKAEGTIEMNSEGFIYVKIDDHYIHDIIPFLKGEGFEEPPYFGEGELVGAHITLITPDEAKKYGIERIDEIGQKILFQLKEGQEIALSNPQGPLKAHQVKAIYLLTVDSPELSSIREKYGLPKSRYDYHITVAVKTALHLLGVGQ